MKKLKYSKKVLMSAWDMVAEEAERGLGDDEIAYVRKLDRALTIVEDVIILTANKIKS